MSARAVCAACGWRGSSTSHARAAAAAAKHVCRTDAGVRRTTRRYRCARCGLEAVYENAGAKEARSWFNQHSCRKRELAMLRATEAAQREALIDRTPKVCLHKHTHEHGTNAAYHLDGCRCIPCVDASSANYQERTRLKAYGRYHKYVPAEFVRDHLAELKAYGIGLKKVSELTGLGNGTLTKIWYGTYADTGRGSEYRHGEGELLRGPSRRVLRSTAEKIYAVEAIPANLGSRWPDHERSPHAQLQLRALVALGWSMSELGRRLGVRHAGNACKLVVDDHVLARGTVDKVEVLYAELSMTPPPQDTAVARAAAARARAYATEHGWLPPLAIEDIDEDLVLDDVDEVAVQRRLNGDTTVELNKAERIELVRRARKAGWSYLDIERKAGVQKPERYLDGQGVAS